MLALLDNPTKGKIILENQDTKNLSINKKDELRSKNISIIFQDNNLLTDFTAIENVMMPLIIRGEDVDVIKEKAKNILKDVKFLIGQIIFQMNFRRRATKDSNSKSFDSRNKINFSR